LQRKDSDARKERSRKCVVPAGDFNHYPMLIPFKLLKPSSAQNAPFSEYAASTYNQRTIQKSYRFFFAFSEIPGTPENQMD
jgi:hypothetical protein